MSLLYKYINKISLWVLLAISIVILVLFFVMPSTSVEINNTYYEEPSFTNPLMNWTLILLCLTVAFTLLLSIIKFVKTFIANPRKGLITLGVLVVFAAVFVVSWFLGDATKLDIIGYEGTDNMGFWAQYSDMCIYATAIMGVSTLVALFGTSIYSKLR